MSNLLMILARTSVRIMKPRLLVPVGILGALVAGLLFGVSTLFGQNASPVLLPSVQPVAGGQESVRREVAVRGRLVFPKRAELTLFRAAGAEVVDQVVDKEAAEHGAMPGIEGASLPDSLKILQEEVTLVDQYPPFHYNDIQGINLPSQFPNQFTEALQAPYHLWRLSTLRHLPYLQPFKFITEGSKRFHHHVKA